MRVALVTGASRGLGAAIAERLGADGFAVAVNYARSPARADEVVARIRATDRTAEAFQADVTDEARSPTLVASVRDALGDVHALVINATGPQPAAAIEDVTWQAHLDQLEFFVKSPTLLMQAVLPGMTRAGGGRVIHVGSDIIERALPGNSAYAAAKAAQLGLARVWSRELAPLGITVNTVAPGWVPVERHASISSAEREDYLGASRSAGWASRRRRRGRLLPRVRRGRVRHRRQPRRQRRVHRRLTSIVPVIPGWIVHSYSTVPGLSTVALNVLPLPNRSDLNVAPELATTLWSMLSSLTQQTSWPTPAVAASGSNLMSTILIVTVPLPQAASDAP